MKALVTERLSSKLLDKLAVLFYWAFGSIYLAQRGAEFMVRNNLPLVVSIVEYMAKTGTGTDECLKKKCLPVWVHYYQPIPEIADLEQQHVWDKISDLGGINFQPEKQVVFLAQIGKEFGKECSWPKNPTPDPFEFYTDNPNFSFACAAVSHSMIRKYKPRRLIEIGSGSSSCVIANALEKNLDSSSPVHYEYTIIDPYPTDRVRALAKDNVILLSERVELQDLQMFDQLQENDILFIDSGHSVRTGSDVNFLILDVLPRLAPGVIVHFHDIGLPYEYAKVYFTNPAFRVFWTESYLLQAFLAFNREFEVLLAVNYLMKNHRAEFCTAFPHIDTDEYRFSGSFWLRRVSKTIV